VAMRQTLKHWPPGQGPFLSRATSLARSSSRRRPRHRGLGAVRIRSTAPQARGGPKVVALARSPQPGASSTASPRAPSRRRPRRTKDGCRSGSTDRAVNRRWRRRGLRSGSRPARIRSLFLELTAASRTATRAPSSASRGGNPVTGERPGTGGRRMSCSVPAFASHPPPGDLRHVWLLIGLLAPTTSPSAPPRQQTSGTAPGRGAVLVTFPAPTPPTFILAGGLFAMIYGADRGSAGAGGC
jgi:hypothetical protein